jgi:hypothetical protein
MANSLLNSSISVYQRADPEGVNNNFLEVFVVRLAAGSFPEGKRQEEEEFFNVWGREIYGGRFQSPVRKGSGIGVFPESDKREATGVYKE